MPIQLPTQSATDAIATADSERRLRDPRPGKAACFAETDSPAICKAPIAGSAKVAAAPSSPPKPRMTKIFDRLGMNGANEILNIRVVSIGLIDRSPVHPREVFADALTDRASAVIVAHNHSSGGLEPSPSDIDVTKS